MTLEAQKNFEKIEEQSFEELVGSMDISLYQKEFFIFLEKSQEFSEEEVFVVRDIFQRDEINRFFLTIGCLLLWGPLSTVVDGFFIANASLDGLMNASIAGLKMWFGYLFTEIVLKFLFIRWQLKSFVLSGIGCLPYVGIPILFIWYLGEKRKIGKAFLKFMKKKQSRKLFVNDLKKIIQKK